MRTARGRAVLAGAASLLVLAGLAGLAQNRISQQHQRYDSLNRTFATVAALEHAQSDLAVLLTSASALAETGDPEAAANTREAAAALEQHLGQARTGALAEGDSTLLVDLDNLIAQIGIASEVTEQRILELADTRSQPSGPVVATISELSRQAYAFNAGLDRLVHEQQDHYTAAASAANNAADANGWLLMGIMAAVAAAAWAAMAALLLPVLRPLASLQASVRAIASGDLYTRARVAGPEEVASLARDFNQMVDERQRADEALQQSATDLERSVDALRESEERLRAVVTSAPVILFAVDRNGTLAFLDGKGLEALGAKPGDGVGRSAFDLFQDIPGMKEDLHRALAGESFTRPVDLSGLTFETHCAPLRGHDGQISGVIGVATDITERRRAEEALQESEARYRRIFENVHDIYYRTDAEGIITEISPSVRQFGYTREELIGTQVLDIYEDPEERSQLLKALFERGVVIDYEVHLKKGDGTISSTSVSTHLLRNPDGSFAGVEGSLRDITERKRMEGALRLSEAKYRQIFENVQDIFYRTDVQGLILELSPSVERYGYRREALLGTQASELYESPEQRAELVRVLLERGEVADYEIQLKAADGSVVDCSLGAHLLRSPDGTPFGLEGFLRDITERKQAAQALARQATLVRGMNRVFEEALTSETEEAVARTCLAVAAALTGSKFGFIGEVNEAGRFDTFAMSDPGWQACRMPDSDAAAAIRDMEIHGMWGGVIKQGRSLIANDPASHPDRVGTPEGHPPITAFLGVPLRRGGKTVGMIALANKECGYDLADQEDVESLSAAFVEALDRKRAEQALRESEARYRRVFDNIHDLFYRTDAHGIITDISPSVERYGYVREQLIGTQVLDVYEDPEERAALLLALAENGVVVDHEVHLKTADGQVRDSSVSAHLLREPDGSPIGVEGSLRDISERKLMEKELRESEQRYRTLVETSPDAITLTDLDAKLIMVNRQAALLHGFESVEEALSAGATAFDLVAPENRERAIQNAQRTLELGTLRDVEYTLLRRDGSRFPGEITSSLVTDAEENPVAFIGVVRDITERKRVEEALREQVRRDPLTGTLNHAVIVEELRDLISNGADGAPHAVAMIDVNDLKVINDTFGHQMGDEVLITVAETLATDGVLVGRYGGDEFVAILPGADRGAAERYRQEVLATLEGVDLRDPDTKARVPVVASVGFAIYPAEAERIEDLIKLADSAMYSWRRQRPVLSPAKTSSRSLGGERAAKMVGEIVPLLTSAGDLTDKLRLVAHRLSVGAGYDAVSFTLRRPGTDEPFSLTTFAELPDETIEAWNRQQRKIGWERNSMRLLAERGRPIILDDPQHDQRLTDTERELLRSAGMQSVMAAPMLWRNELVGLLSVASKRKDAFAPKDAQFLMAVAGQVTGIVRMATLVGELQSTSTRLAQAQTETVLLLAAAAEAHDHATGLHLLSVRALTETLAAELGYPEEEAEELGLAAVLHDIGKVRVPDVVLSTAGELTDREWELMKQHTVWGGDFLSGRPGFELAATIARSHHERWDGSGYPDGLVGETIPQGATIVAVADAFDAMISDRPYRAARSVAAAVREIMACSGAQFSPTVVQALVRLHKRRKLPRLRNGSLGRLAA